MRDRRAQRPSFPFLALGFGMYLLSLAADAASLAAVPGPWDVVALAAMGVGAMFAVRAALPALEDLFWLKRSLSPMRSSILAAYGIGAVVLWFVSEQLRYADPAAALQPMLLTVAAFFALLAAARFEADRPANDGRRPVVDLSATQRIARASLDF